MYNNIIEVTQILYTLTLPLSCFVVANNYFCEMAYQTSLMINQHWWLGACGQQPIAWANFDPTTSHSIKMRFVVDAILKIGKASDVAIAWSVENWNYRIAFQFARRFISKTRDSYVKPYHSENKALVVDALRHLVLRRIIWHWSGLSEPICFQEISNFYSVSVVKHLYRLPLRRVREQHSAVRYTPLFECHRTQNR